MTRELIIENQFLLDQPINIIWSDFHNQFIVVGKNTICLLNSETFKIKPFQSADGYEFKNAAVDRDGRIAILLQSISSPFGQIKIMSGNLFSIEKTIDIYDSKLKQLKFSDSGNLIVIAELNIQSNLESILSKAIIIEKDGRIGESIFATKGEIVGVEIKQENFAIAISYGGDVVSIPTDFYDFQNSKDSSTGSSDSLNEIMTSESSLEIVRFSPKIIGNIGAGVSSFSIRLEKMTLSESLQRKVRVFVGSRPWQNDRWDSQEVNSKKTSILYGGGDNLIPGASYWVHISIWNEESGWSSPQIKKFTMPYRPYEDSSSESSFSTLSSSSSSVSSSTHIMTTSSSQSSASSSSTASSSSSNTSSSSISSTSSSSMSSSSSSNSSSSSDTSSQSYLIEEGMVIATVGSDGHYAVSTDYGTSWTTNSFMSPSNNGIIIVMSSDGTSQYVIESDGTHSYIWRSQNTGSTWDSVHTHTGVGTTTGACTPDGKTITFVIVQGTTRNILSSHNYGVSWNLKTLNVTTSTHKSPVLVSRTGETQLVAIKNVIYRSIDFGVTFYPYLSYPSTSYAILGLGCRNNFDNLIIYARYIPDETGTFRRWIVATFSIGTWTVIYGPSYVTNWMGDGDGIYQSAAGRYIIFPDANTMHLNMNYGIGSWVHTASFGVETQVKAFNVSKSGKYAVYTNGYTSSDTHYLLYSSDYGQSWTQKTTYSKILNGVAISSGSPLPVSSSTSSSLNSSSSSSTEHFYDTGHWEKVGFDYHFGGSGSVSSAFMGLLSFNLTPPNDNNTNDGRVWVHGEVSVTMNIPNEGHYFDTGVATITVYRDEAKTDVIATGSIYKSNEHPYFNNNSIYGFGNAGGTMTIEPAYIDPLHPFSIIGWTGFYTFISYSFDDVWQWVN